MYLFVLDRDSIVSVKGVFALWQIYTEVFLWYCLQNDGASHSETIRTSLLLEIIYIFFWRYSYEL